MTAAKAKGVRTTHPDYDAMLPLWTRCADAAEGEHVVHAKGEAYLPALREEAPADYQARLKRTPWFNATWRTISGLKGMLFRTDPQVKVAKAIEPFMQDVDMAGTPLDIFAQEVSEELLTVGRVGVMVDYPPVVITESTTKAQAETMGGRPMLGMYKAPTIINWKTARINGVLKLTMATLMEMADIEGEDEFAQAKEQRYRVLDLLSGQYRQRVYRIDQNGNDEQVGADIFPLRNNTRLDFIPFYIINVDHIGTKVESPPLLDLADMNFHHYTVSADWEHACHYSGLPTLFITGHTKQEEDEKIYIGGASANILSDAQAKAFYVETKGEVASLEKNLESKKSEMAVLGARMLENTKASVESSETIQQRTQGEQSQLAGMAKIQSLAFTEILKEFSNWDGAGNEAIYKINTDFLPVGMTPEAMTALVNAWQTGAISHQTLFDNLQRGEVIKQDMTFEEEQERVASNPPVLLGEPEDESDPLKKAA